MNMPPIRIPGEFLVMQGISGADPLINTMDPPEFARMRFSLQQFAVMRYYAQNEHQIYASSCEELPDIFVDVERIRDSVRFDEELSFFVHMVNNLQKDTVIDLTAQISSDRVIFDDVIYTETIDASEGDGNILRNITVRIPPSLPEGRFFVRVFADANQMHEEGNEFNNFVTSEFILDHSSINSGTLFPNPASDVIHYYYQANYPGGHVLRIFNAAGQIVGNHDLPRVRNEPYFRQPPGSYRLLPLRWWLLPSWVLLRYS